MRAKTEMADSSEEFCERSLLVQAMIAAPTAFSNSGSGAHTIAAPGLRAVLPAYQRPAACRFPTALGGLEGLGARDGGAHSADDGWPDQRSG